MQRGRPSRAAPAHGRGLQPRLRRLVHRCGLGLGLAHPNPNPNPNPEPKPEPDPEPDPEPNGKPKPKSKPKPNPNPKPTPNPSPKPNPYPYPSQGTSSSSYISPVSPLHLPDLSPISPRYLPGHFELVRALLPALQATAGARVVTVSSVMHWFGQTAATADWDMAAFDSYPLHRRALVSSYRSNPNPNPNPNANPNPPPARPRLVVQ